MPANTVNRAARPSAPVTAVVEAPAPVAAQEEAPRKFVPVPYYNPKILDERFLVGGSPYHHYFNRGKYVAVNEMQEQAVRAALRAHGPDKPDRWRGDDRKPWTDRRTGFTTGNEAAKEDFEFFHQD